MLKNFDSNIVYRERKEDRFKITGKAEIITMRVYQNAIWRIDLHFDTPS